MCWKVPFVEKPLNIHLELTGRGVDLALFRYICALTLKLCDSYCLPIVVLFIDAWLCVGSYVGTELLNYYLYVGDIAIPTSIRRGNYERKKTTSSI